MAGSTWRRIAGSALALVGAVGAISVGSLRANGLTATRPWGTFAHIATSNLVSESDKQTAAQNYDLIAIRGDFDAPLLADLHRRRPGIVLLAYEKAAGLNAAEVKDLKVSHPEWIARDSTGQMIHPENISDTTLADLTNPAFRQWSADKIAAEVAQGADGAFIDTLGAFFPSDFYTARPVVGGVSVTDAAWRDGSADLVRRVKTTSQRMVIANGFGLASGSTYYPVAADADQIITAADGVQIENFTRTANAAPDQFRPAAAWDQDLAFLELLGARGKVALAYTKVKPAANSAQLTLLRDYALASFLLSYTPDRSYFGFDEVRNGLPAVQSDPSWSRGLGNRLGAKIRFGADGWLARFDTGRVTVNAGKAPVVVGSTPPPPTTVAASTSSTVSSTTTSSVSSTTSSTVAPTTTTTVPPTTTSSSTTTIKPTTTTTTTVPPGTRQTITFTGSGADRVTFPLTVGAGQTTAVLQFGGAGARTLGIFQDGTQVAGPNSGTGVVVLTTRLSAGAYKFAVNGPNTGSFTLRVDYTAPRTTVAASRPIGGLAMWIAVLLVGVLLALPVRLTPKRGAHRR